MTGPEQPRPENANQPTEPPEKVQAPKKGQDGNAEFERLTKADLKSIPVFPQALDNQWLPRPLLEKAQKSRKGARKFDKQLKKAVRAEYLRSLINGQQAVINRAFIYNNPAISQDYILKNSPESEAFKALLAEGTIIPSLYLEESPIDRPEFDVQEEPFARWQELCTELRTHCIRLSWDKEENEDLTVSELARRFHIFALGAAARDINTYLADLGLDSSAKEIFRQRLVELGRFCLDFSSQDKLVTRNILYKAFVTAETDPAQRVYDSSPIAGAIKQLLDLSYNCNLPDALGGYLITPIDTLPRTALQEWQQAVKRPMITGKELLTLLQRTKFDLVGKDLNVKSMDVLRLQDVREIRNTDEWKGYIESLEALLEHPTQFADGGAVRVYQSYARLAKQITDLISRQERNDQVLTSWAPTIELIFNIAGAILTWKWTEAGSIWQLHGKVPRRIQGDTAPVVGKLVIRDISEKRPQQDPTDLSTGIDFMRFTIPNVQEEWKQIEQEVRKLSGFQDLPAVSREKEMAKLSYKEQ